MPFTQKTRRAVKRYGADACLKAFHMHSYGHGALYVGWALGLPVIRTSRQVAAAINAGQELARAEEINGRVCQDSACEAVQGVINALRQKPGNFLADALVGALRWALEQLENDVDFDQQDAFVAACAVLDAATLEPTA